MMQNNLEIKNLTSIQLCEIIISNRYLGLFPNLLLPSMEELSSRRINGDNFDFEKYIEENLKDLPELYLNPNNLGELINIFTNLKGKSNE